jgi:hypothetical protein
MLLVHLSICWKVRSQYSQQAAVNSHDHLRSLLAVSECGCLSLCEGNARFCAVLLVSLPGTVACVHNFTRILCEIVSIRVAMFFSKMCQKFAVEIFIISCDS